MARLTLRVRAQLLGVACVVAFIVLFAQPVAADLTASDWQPYAAKEHRLFELKLRDLAGVAERTGWEREADIARRWHIKPLPGRHFFFVPPTTDTTAPPADATERQLKWHAEFMRLRRVYAGLLLAGADAARRDGNLSEAMQLVHRAMREDPANEVARKLLQYQREGDGPWLTRFEARQISDGKADHPKFGWVAPAELKKLEAGLRPLGSRWVGQEEADRVAGRHIDRGWMVETEHFRIQTNHSWEAGVALGRNLEDLHCVWRQMFAGYWYTPAEIRRMFEGESPRMAERKHRVLFFRNKEQYVDYLKADVPNIAMSLGYYAEKPKTTYLYAGDPRAEATWFHEATHQLFHERQLTPKTAGRTANFWAVEGVATYMESLTAYDGYYAVGGPGSYRLQFGRYRALTEGFYVGSGEFCGLGRQEIQANKDLPRLYSQAAGLSHFFLDGDGEQGQQRRRQFVEYLNQIYRDKADATTLARVTGKRFEQLDRGYMSFLQLDDRHTATLRPNEAVSRLYLGRTKLTDKSMPHIAALSGLTRLDLGYTNVTDRGVALLKPGELVQLNLEQTDATAAALGHLAKFTTLQELDLSGLPITDESLAHLAKLKNLQILWLTNTRVTDAGLAHLHGLKNLQFLDTTNTRVTKAGWARLKQAVPAVTDEQ